MVSAFEFKAENPILESGKIFDSLELAKYAIPVAIIERFVMLSSKEDGLILDPFMGSGSTGEAALTNNRNFIGMEIDEKYFNVAKERIENIETNKIINT